MRDKRVVYSINVQDIQDIAVAELGRRLSSVELKAVEAKLGEFIHWDEAIARTIDDVLEGELLR